LSKQRREREKARQYAAADFSEDLSEGEKGENSNEPSIHDERTRTRMPRIGSTDAIEAWTSQHKDKKLYIVLIRYGALELIAAANLLFSFNVNNGWSDPISNALSRGLSIVLL